MISTMALVSRCLIKTFLGNLIAIGDDDHLYLLAFEKDKHLAIKLRQLEAVRGKAIENEHAQCLRSISRELEAYFAGTLKQFQTPLKPIGTPFQVKVWETLQKVPHGTTSSYKELAQAVGNEKGVRAVANANGKNPIAIAIPCHRIIGADGSCGGYSAGIEKKNTLIALELDGIFC